MGLPLVKNIHGVLCSERNRQLLLRDFAPNMRNVDTSLVLLAFSQITVSFKFVFTSPHSFLTWLCIMAYPVLTIPRTFVFTPEILSMISVQKVSLALTLLHLCGNAWMFESSVPHLPASKKLDTNSWEDGTNVEGVKFICETH